VSDPILGLSMLGLIVAAIMMGFPTAFTMMGLGMLFGYAAFWDPSQPWYENHVFDLMVQRTYGAMNNDTLLSIPLFVFMGYVIERAALVDKMFYSVQLAFRRVPASLAVTTLLVCAFWGIASGIVGAVVVLMGVIALRPMLNAGYDIRLASGAITAGGTLGILIPPSVMLIVYAAVAGQSIVKLYAAAMLPGFFLTFLYLVYIVGWAVINPKVAPKLPPDQYRIAVPDWIARLERGARKRVIGSLALAALQPGAVKGMMADGRPVTYGTIVNNLLAALVPVGLTVAVFAAAWWYVVIHNAPEVEPAPATAIEQPADTSGTGLAEPEAENEGAEELGTGAIEKQAAPTSQGVEELGTGIRSEAQTGVGQVPDGFYEWFAGVAVIFAGLLAFYYWRMDGEQL
jgi:TRAP-type mannitol/chloroaromatic compound transport system permease large subunit